MTTVTPRKSGWLGPIFVTVASAILTITILGSAVYLGVRFYEKRRRETEIQSFVHSLPNRSPDELAAQAEQLQQRKGVRRYLLPEIQRTMLTGPTEQQRWSAVRISEAFLESKGIRKTLVRISTLPPESVQERVAAEATRVLGKVRPPEEAARLIRSCLSANSCPAVVDEVCAALFGLGPVGLETAKACSMELSEGRKLWLVRYISEQGDIERQREWLNWLAANDHAAVAKAATDALSTLKTATSMAGAG